MNSFERWLLSVRPEPARLLVLVRYKTVHAMFSRYIPELPGRIFRLRSLLRVGAPGPVPGYRISVVNDFWEEDNSGEFERIWNETMSGACWPGWE